MRILHGLAAAALAAILGVTAQAETQSQVLFRHKHWMVEGVTFDDGTVACVAELDDPDDSFSIWTYPDTSIKLQFYSTSWDFGEDGGTADLELQIDRRAPWSLTDADLYKNSVLFTLPGSDEAVNLLMEVANGSRLYLRDSDGQDVVWYSLAGSSASMSAMIDCGTAISRDTNPFN